MDADELAFWDPLSRAWLAEAGELLLWSGQSSRSRSRPTSIVLTDRWTAPPSAAIAAG